MHVSLVGLAIILSVWPFLFSDISKNRYSEVPPSLCEYQSMEELNCYHNVIRILPQALVQLQSLVKLNLRYALYCTVHLSVYPSIHLSARPSVCLSIHPSVCPSICLLPQCDKNPSPGARATTISSQTKPQVCIILYCPSICPSILLLYYIIILKVQSIYINKCILWALGP